MGKRSHDTSSRFVTEQHEAARPLREGVEGGARIMPIAWKPFAMAIAAFGAMAISPGPAAAQNAIDILQGVIQRMAPPPGGEPLGRPMPRDRAPGWRQAPPADRPGGNAALARLQDALNRLGYDAGVPDGRFGAQTARAIRAFQQQYGLPVTGTATPGLVAFASERANEQSGSASAGTARAPVAETVAPAFDCHQATTAVERLICRSPALATRDAALAERYEAALSNASGPQAASVRAAQRDWLARRSRCGMNAGCLTAAYDNRLAELGGAVPPSGGDDASGDLAGGSAVGGPARTAGLEDFALTYRLGRPVVAQDPRVDPTTGRGVQSLLALLSIRENPDVLGDDNRARSYAYNLLSPEERQRTIPSQQWAGADEFARADTYRQFVATWKARAQSAPALPIEMVAVSQSELGTYSAEEGGFPVIFRGGRPELPFGSVGGYYPKETDPQPLPSLWMLDERAARAVPAKLDRSRSIFMAREFSLDSVEVVPEKYDFTVRTTLQRVRIFADPELKMMLAELPLVKPKAPTVAADVPMRDGRVLVAGNAMGDTWNKLGRFFDLVALGANPKAIEKPEVAINFAQSQPAIQNSAVYVTGSYWAGGNEFEKAASARRFIAEWGPKLVAAAPTMPVPFTAAVATYLRQYDERCHCFPLDERHGTVSFPSFAAHGAVDVPLGMSLPDRWVVTPQAAEVALGKTRNRVAYFGVSGRIEGVEKPEGGGLGSVFRVSVESITLYADQDLKVALADFPVTKLPTPYLVADASVEPHGAPLMSQESVVMFAAKTMPDIYAKIAWPRLLERRRGLEQELYGNPATWFDRDPWPPFFPPGSRAAGPDTLERYQAWTKARAAAMPAKLQAFVTWNTSGSNRGAIELLPAQYDGSWSPQEQTALQKAGVPQDQASLIDSGVMPAGVFLVYPAKRDSYALSFTDPEWQAFAGGTIQIEIDFDLSGPRLSNGVLLVDAVPQQAVVTDAATGKTILTRSFADMVQNEAAAREKARSEAAAKADAAKRAQEAADEKRRLVEAEKLAAEKKARQRPDGAYGPELAGIRLGMSLAEADGRIRKFMPVAAVAIHAKGGWGYAPILLTRTVYGTADGSKRLAVFSNPANHDRVLAATLWTALPNGSLSDDQLRDLLEKTYGKVVTPGSLVWYAGAGDASKLTGSCRGTLYSGGDPGYSYSEGGIDPKRLGGNGADGLADKVTATLPQILNHQGQTSSLAEIRDCPAVLWAQVDRGGREDGIGLALVDAGWAANILLDVRKEEADKAASAVAATLAPSSAGEEPGEAKDAPPATAAAAPGASGAGGFDILGIRLGMTIEAAEALIRDHMKVGRTAIGMRTAIAGLPPQIYGSGKLFISDDGREMIALYDEPPAAKGTVVAAWRRLYLPAGSVPLTTVGAQLETKYGPPAHLGANGLIRLWGARLTPPCEASYLNASNRALAQEWYADGKPIDWAPPNGAIPAPSGYLIALDRTAGQIALASCGPVLEGIFLPRVGNPGMDVIETVLTDNDTYLPLFTRTLQGTPATEAAPAAPSLKF